MMRTTLVIVAVAVVGVVTWLLIVHAQSPGVQEMEGKPTGDRVVKTDAEWRRQLSPQEYRITRRKGTEVAGTGRYCNTKDDGVYQCVCCAQPLFDSSTKYDSGTGWPSFEQPVREGAVSRKLDRDLFSVRMEVLCSRCDAHLGHVFDDGPQPTGQRYCLNSAALRLVPREPKQE